MHNDPRCPLYTYWIAHCSDTEAKLKQQVRRIKEIEDCGWKVHTVWGCQWANYQKGIECGEGPLAGHAKAIQQFINRYLIVDRQESYTFKESDLVQSIIDGDMEGIVSCELAPASESVRQKFLEFPPIYKKAMVDKSELGEYTINFCKKFGLCNKPRQQLISVTESRGESSRMDTRVLRWLVRQGYNVVKLHYFARYRCVPVFRDIINRLVDLRRYGDGDPSLAPISQMVKIFLNAGQFSKLLGRRLIFC